MFKVFLLLSIIAISFVLYNTYSKTSSKSTSSLAILSGETTIYTKSYCPYCIKAKALLTSINIPYKEISLDNNLELHQELMKETNQRTVPYVYLKGKFIGGCDDLHSLYKQDKI